MELEPGGGSARVGWADVAKAFSIILLVIWSIFGVSIYFDQMLILARMPLFFFVSGLFAHRVVTRSEPGPFLRDKIGNLVYLYALWAFIWFVSTEVVAWLWWGREIETRLHAMIWEPVTAMWFFYGLAIAFGLAYLCRRLPVGLVLAVALGAYAAVVATGDWLDIPFVGKVVRLFPYFWLGLVLRPLVGRLVEAHWRLWPLLTAIFLGLSGWVMQSPWQGFGPLTFVVTLTGIAALLGLAAQVSRFDWAWVVRLIGGSTLYIYATHYITAFYLERAFGAFGTPPFDWVLVVVIVVAFGTVFGRFCARRDGLKWLFAAPWIAAKPPARVRARGAEA